MVKKKEYKTLFPNLCSNCHVGAFWEMQWCADYFVQRRFILYD